MLARVVPALEVPPGLLESWGSLHERALEQNPFYEPPCVVAAARHLPYGAQIDVLLAVEDDTVVGALPLRSLSRWHWMPRGAATSNVRRLKWLGTPLLDRDRADEALTTMLEHLRDRRRRSGDQVLVLEWMHAGGPAADLLRRVTAALRLPVATGERFERPGYLRPRGAVNDAHDEESLVHRARSAHKKRRRLAADLGAVRMLDRSDDHALVGELLALEAAGYKSAAGIALRNWPGEPEWFADMYGSFASQGRAIGLSLVAGETTLAVMTAITADDEVYLCVTSFDESFARYSPGIQLHYDTIDFAVRSHVRRIDTCTYADNQTEADIYPDRIAITTFLIGLGSPTERALLRALPAAQRARARLRKK